MLLLLALQLTMSYVQDLNAWGGADAELAQQATSGLPASGVLQYAMRVATLLVMIVFILCPSPSMQLLCKVAPRCRQRNPARAHDRAWNTIGVTGMVFYIALLTIMSAPFRCKETPHVPRAMGDDHAVKWLDGGEHATLRVLGGGRG